MVGDHPSALARRRPGALVIVARLVLATFAYLTALIGLEALAALVVKDETGPFVGLVVAEAAALGTVLIVWRFVDRRPLRELGLVLPLAPRQWLRGALVAALMMSCIVLVWYTLINGATWVVNPNVGRAALALVAGFVGFLIQGPSEELLYRGYVLENVRDRWGAGWGVAVSAITFSLLHAANPAFGLLPGLNLALFGVATALYKLRWDQGQLWGVFAIHTVWNWLQQVVFGLPNSGTVLPLENVVFQVWPDTSLPAFMWGGGFGPEGTLGATLVLGALIWAELRRR